MTCCCGSSRRCKNFRAPTVSGWLSVFSVSAWIFAMPWLRLGKAVGMRAELVCVALTFYWNSCAAGCAWLGSLGYSQFANLSTYPGWLRKSVIYWEAGSRTRRGTGLRTWVCGAAPGTINRTTLDCLIVTTITRTTIGTTTGFGWWSLTVLRTGSVMACFLSARSAGHGSHPCSPRQNWLACALLVPFTGIEAGRI